MRLEININNPELSKLLKLYNMFKTDTNKLPDIINFCINFTYKEYYQGN